MESSKTVDINKLLELGHYDSVARTYFSMGISHAINHQFQQSYEMIIKGLDFVSCDCSRDGWLAKYPGIELFYKYETDVTGLTIEYHFVKAYLMSFETSPKYLKQAMESIDKYLEVKNNDYGHYVEGKINLNLKNPVKAMNCFKKAEQFASNARLLYIMGTTRARYFNKDGIELLFDSFQINPKSVCCARNINYFMKNCGVELTEFFDNDYEQDNNYEISGIFAANNNVWEFDELYRERINAELEKDNGFPIALKEGVKPDSLEVERKLEQLRSVKSTLSNNAKSIMHFIQDINWMIIAYRNLNDMDEPHDNSFRVKKREVNKVKTKQNNPWFYYDGPLSYDDAFDYDPWRDVTENYAYEDFEGPEISYWEDCNNNYSEIIWKYHLHTALDFGSFLGYQIEDIILFQPHHFLWCIENVENFKYKIDFVYYIDFITRTRYQKSIERAIILFTQELQKPMKKALRIPMNLSDAFERGLTAEERDVFAEYMFPKYENLKDFLTSNLQPSEWPFCN